MKDSYRKSRRTVVRMMTLDLRLYFRKKTRLSEFSDVADQTDSFHLKWNWLKNKYFYVKIWQFFEYWGLKHLHLLINNIPNRNVHKLYHRIIIFQKLLNLNGNCQLAAHDLRSSLYLVIYFTLWTHQIKISGYFNCISYEIYPEQWNIP